MTNSLHRLRVSLLLLRAGIVIVLLAWTVDKLMRPAHGAGVLEHFYGVGGFGNAPIYALAIGELVLIALFASGLFKTWTYGLVLLLHAATTLVPFR